MLSVFNILIHEVHRKFDKKCIKTLKIANFSVFCDFWVFPEKTAFISSKTTTGQRILALLNLFNILIRDNYRKIAKIALKHKKLEIFAIFLILGVIFGSFWGPWCQLKKSTNLHKYKSHEAKCM